MLFFSLQVQNFFMDKEFITKNITTTFLWPSDKLVRETVNY